MKPVTRQRGLSLVELMVAMVIGLILIAGIVQIFVGSRQTYALSDGLARLQENGRFGMDFLTRDIRMSGQVGCGFRNATSLLAASANSLAFDPAVAVSGLEYTGTGPGNIYPISSLDPATAGASNWTDNTGATLNTVVPALDDRVVPGSDILMTRSAQSVPNLAPKGNTPANAAAITTAQATGLAQGSLLLVSDCQAANLFQNHGGPTANRVSRDTGCGGHSPCNVVVGTTDWTKDWDESARIFRFSSKAYYIGASDRDGDTVPDATGLWEADFSNGLPARRQELVEGVENMQLLYGVDGDGGPDRSVTQYMTADAVPDWRDVLSVRVALLMRSADEVPVEPDTRVYELLTTDNTAANTITINPADERRVRRVFATTVAVRNAVMRAK